MALCTTESLKHFQNQTSVEIKRGKRDLRNEHDPNGDASHEIRLQVLSPIVLSNPTIARQAELHPLRPRHPLDLLPPPQHGWARNRGRGRRRSRRMLQRYNLHRAGSPHDGGGGGKRRRRRRRVGSSSGAEVAGAWRRVGYLPTHWRKEARCLGRVRRHQSRREERVWMVARVVSG